MVIGNGMLAQAFKHYADNDDIIIFASGVSNSREQDDASFSREYDLMKTYAQTDKKFIYFSTCSIFDRSLKDSDYIKHKLAMENYIQCHFAHYIIFRLPIVIGNSKNQNTFFNSFKNKISNKEKLTIYKNATRNIIDVDDLACILPDFINNKDCDKRVINVLFNNKATVLCLVNIMEDVLKIKVEKDFANDGYDYDVDNSYFMDYVDKNNYGISKKYNFIVLKKYLTWNE